MASNRTDWEGGTCHSGFFKRGYQFGDWLGILRQQNFIPRLNLLNQVGQLLCSNFLGDYHAKDHTLFLAKSREPFSAPVAARCMFAISRLPRLVWRMKDNQHQFLALLGQLPARLTAEQAGWVLNCQSHDIPALIAARLLKPLGNPAANAGKFFATADILENTKDRAWLVKVTTTISQHWQHQNARKRSTTLQLPAPEFELAAAVSR